MKRLAILASVVALAAMSANCEQANAAGPSPSVLAPSAMNAAATEARRGGGGGGGKGGTTGGSGSLVLVMVSDVNGDGSPNWGDSVKFTVSTTATTEPNVRLTCSQGGAVVYGAVTGYYQGYLWPWTQVMTLSSGSWTGGSASCVAELYYISGNGTTTLASMSFTAGA